MKRGLIARLRCPRCGGTLDLRGAATDDEISEGVLVCRTCRAEHVVTRHVPRFVSADNYTASFGLEWNRFSTTQLDSRNGTTISHDRFLAQTRWTAATLTGARVLDVGCGAGRFAEVALAFGAEVFAIDYSSAVDAAWRNIGAHPRAHVIQADACALPFAPASFDYIYCLGVLQHTPDPQATVRALVEHVRPGGEFVIDVYLKYWAAYLHPKLYLRPLTTRLPTALLAEVVYRATPTLLRVSRKLGRTPTIGRYLRRFVPVANYEGVYPLSDEQLVEWSRLDTLDWLSPRYDYPQTPATLRGWLVESGLEDDEVYRARHLTGRGRRPSSARREPARASVLIGPLPPPHVGQSVSFEMLCEGFRERKLPARVINIGGGGSRADSAFSWGRAASYVWPILQSVPLVRGRPKNVYLTIAQSWNGFLRDLAFISLSAIGRHRLVLHLKGGNYAQFYASQSLSRQRLIRAALSRAARIIVLGDSLRSMFDFLPDHADKVCVVRNGLPLSASRLPTAPKRLPARHEGPVRILYLSNLIESKGYLDVLAAVRQLAREHDVDVQCDLCGEVRIAADARLYHTAADAERGVREFIARHDLEREVRWQGPVIGEAKERELEQAHFFVLPTNYVNEGQPVSIIEALAYGCVVVSTRHRTIPEMLDGGRAGVLVDYGAPRQIAEAILECMEDPDRYHELSLRAMHQYQTLFSRQVHLDAIVAEIIGGSASLGDHVSHLVEGCA